MAGLLMKLLPSLCNSAAFVDWPLGHAGSAGWACRHHPDGTSSVSDWIQATCDSGVARATAALDHGRDTAGDSETYSSSSTKSLPDQSFSLHCARAALAAFSRSRPSDANRASRQPIPPQIASLAYAVDSSARYPDYRDVRFR